MSKLTQARHYFSTQFSWFDDTKWFSKKVLTDGLKIAAVWGLPAIAAVWLNWRLPRIMPVAYVSYAITEGISPHLWNIVGTIGLEFFGLATLFPKATWLARAAHKVLANTYSIGALAFGLLLGQMIVLGIGIQPDANPLTWLQFSLLLLLVAEVFLLNFMVWYLATLVAAEMYGVAFLNKLAAVDLRLRMPFAFAVMTMPVLFLALER